MDVRARPLTSQVERIRRIQELGFSGAGLLDQMPEDEEKSYTSCSTWRGDDGCFAMSLPTPVFK